MKTASDSTLEIRIKRETETPRLVHFGRRGHTTYFAKRGDTTSREQGYDDPEDFFAPSKWWAHDYMTQRDASQYEGVAWVNVREAVETDAGCFMAIRGPMVDVNLADGEVDECPRPSDFFAVAVADNQFGALLGLQAAHKATKQTPGPLDSVCIAEYLRLWKEAGATCGVIRNGQFITA